NQAAQYWLQHGGNMDEAVRMSDRSIQIAENFQNLTTRAAILDKKGNSKGAAELRAKAMGLATENDLNQFGYGLLAQKKVDEAIAIFQKNVQAHPASWNVYDSLGEAYLAKGDTQAASDNYSKALSRVKAPPNRKRTEQPLVGPRGKYRRPRQASGFRQGRHAALPAACRRKIAALTAARGLLCGRA